MVPTVGHFHPLVPLARAAIHAGHEIAFASATAFLPIVNRVGFRGFAAGLGDVPAEMLHPELRSLIGTDRTDYYWEHVFATDRAQAMLADLIPIITQFQPDIIVRDQAELGGYLAAEIMSLPHATVQTVSFRPRLHARIAGPLNRLRLDGGLEADPQMNTLYRYLFLSTLPPSYPDPAIALPLTTHHMRPVPFDQSGNETLPAWVEGLPNPIVYATLGTTTINRRPNIFHAILQGLRDEPLNLILTVGRDQDPMNFGPQPTNVHIERYIPQSLLFPRCQAVISHAGSGTTIEAMIHELPMVLIPLAADQPENAERCAALGIACVIDSDSITPEIVRANMLTILQDPAYQQKAGQIQNEITAMPGPEHAVDLLEILVAGGQISS